LKSRRIKRLKTVRNPAFIDRVICWKKNVEQKDKSLRTVQNPDVPNQHSLPSVFCREVHVWIRYPHRRASPLNKELMVIDVVVGSHRYLHTVFYGQEKGKTPV
jgi:hypothetical protein